jgi:hypothetical protein
VLGGAIFPSGTTYSDWPLEPIELVDGIPFLVSQGYILAGHAEHPLQYLSYCIQECDWSSFRFAPKSVGEKQRALQKLLSSPKWKRPLDDRNRAFFAAQIR